MCNKDYPIQNLFSLQPNINRLISIYIPATLLEQTINNTSKDITIFSIFMMITISIKLVH